MTVVLLSLLLISELIQAALKASDKQEKSGLNYEVVSSVHPRRLTWIFRFAGEKFYDLLNNPAYFTLFSSGSIADFEQGDEIFVHTFEGQYHHMKAKPLNVEYVTMDASLLLPATQTPLTGIDFIKRLPCGDDERTQRASHIFILMRELTLDLQNESESYLPLSHVVNPVKENEVLDLNNSDLIACTIVQQGKQSIRRFLVIDTSQFILVEPDTSKLGWGVVKFVSHLQDVEATPDKDDSRSLHIVIQQPFTRRSKSGFNPLPILTAKFIFDDYIRCMSARQRLQKRRDALRHRKMTTMAILLELPAMASPPSQYYSITSLDSPGSVWSPSSRGYSNSSRQSSSSSPTMSASLSAVSNTQQKSKILSPKHEEILQSHIRQDNGDKNRAKTSYSITSPSEIKTNENCQTPQKAEAVALAGLLQTSPPVPEVEGHISNRLRSETTEVGEEVDENSATLGDNSSSFVLVNASASIERNSETILRARKNSKAKLEKRRAEEKRNNELKSENILSNNQSFETECLSQPNGPELQGPKKNSKPRSNSEGGSLESEFEVKSLDLIDLKTGQSSKVSVEKLKGIEKSKDIKKCDSAPGSPSGRRREKLSMKETTENFERLSKSLPAMALSSPTLKDNERKQRAQRARAKAKVVKTKKLRR